MTNKIREEKKPPMNYNIR